MTEQIEEYESKFYGISSHEIFETILTACSNLLVGDLKKTRRQSEDTNWIIQYLLYPLCYYHFPKP